MAVATTALLTLAELKTLLGLPATPSDQDGRFEALINAVSIWIEHFTARYFVIREDYVEHHEPPPRNAWQDAQWLRKWARGQRLFLRRYPIVSLTSIVDEAGFSIPITEVNVRAEVGELYRSGGWFTPQDTFGTPARWAITYDVGFFNSTTDVSADLKQAAAMMVAIRFASVVNGGLSSGLVTARTLGKVSVSYGGVATMGEGAIAQGVPDEVAQLLGPWMSRDV